MPWIKLDDAMLENPKVAAAGPIGFALHVAAIIYSARNLTDGFIPYGHARRLLATEWTEDADDDKHRVWELSAACGMHGESGHEVIEHIIPVLCDCGLWDVVPHGYSIHDYLDYNPSRAQVLAEREAKRAAGQAGGQASAQARAKPRAQASAQAKSNPVPVPVARPVLVLKEPPIVPLGKNGVKPPYGIPAVTMHVSGPTPLSETLKTLHLQSAGRKETA